VQGVIVIAAFVLAGCAIMEPQPEQWTKPGSRTDELAVQLYVCEQWSRNAEQLRDCMTDHGWKQASSEP
jgi:hypothetical protein